MRFLITTPAELLQVLEGQAQQTEAKIAHAKNGKDRAYYMGEFNGFQEAIFYVQEHLKTVEKAAKEGVGK